MGKSWFDRLLLTISRQTPAYERAGVNSIARLNFRRLASTPPEPMAGQPADVPSAG